MRSRILTGVGVALIGAGALALSVPEKPPAGPRAAIERSLDFIEREGFAWMDGRVPIQDGKGCVSCHQVGYAVWSLREARRRGIERPGTEVDALEHRALTFLNPDTCRAASCAPLLFARDRSDERPDVRGVSEQILDIQDDGHWRARGQFPTQRRPIEESDAVVTMWTLLAQESLRGADDDDLDDSHAAADRWLRAADSGESTEWFLARLLVEHRAGNADGIASFTREVLERQNPDGGWAWRGDQASDAMTTGQVVYALAVAGGSDATRKALDRGVAYLLSSQKPDGRWITASRLVSTEPSEGKDYVYTFWGTAWASIGLSRALDVTPRP